MIVRRKFPQIYEFEHPQNGRYWLVSARSKRWGMNERKTFPTKKLAEEYSDGIEENIRKFGAQTDVPKEKVFMAERYQGLTDKLSPLGRSVEDAVDYYHQHLGQEALRQIKPFIRDLVDQWEKYKKSDQTVTKRYLNEVHSQCMFIRRAWGSDKPDDLKRNASD
jgi:hypothetical protein